MTFRKLLFWMHLTAGVLGGLLIFVMCVTGAALTYERQINAWADRKDLAYQPPSDGTPRLPVETLLARVMEAAPAPPANFGMSSDSTAPAEAGLGREGSLFVNPYTGEIVPGSAAGASSRAFFRVMEDWHRWLGSSGESRQRGKAVMDAANLIFFFIVLSGIYLWFPRRMTWRHFRPVVWFRRGLSGKARDFNWHNVIGVWSWAPLTAVVGSGVIISYPWASNMLYTLTGSPVPVQQAKGKEARGKDGKGKETRERRDGGAEAASFQGLNAAWARAEQRVPDWKSIRLNLGANPQAPYSFTIDRGNGGQPHLRSTLTVDRRSGQVRSFTSFADNSTGQRWRQIARFAHTGEVLGVAGQTAAGIATLGGAFLVFTGIALAIRRYFRWLQLPSSTHGSRTGSDGDDRDSLAA
jgi:uncharacterized iron-regulated membrane protein